MNKPNLRIVHSSGTPNTGIYRHDDGRVEEFTRRATPCDGCGRPTSRGEEITYYEGVWWHASCVRADLADRPASAAWFALAEQVVKRPSSFKASEIKVITRKILDIAVTPLDGDPA